jgi:Phage tail baseplate hub (GPD)
MTTLLTPAYRLSFGAHSVDTTAEPKASTVTDLVVAMDMDDLPDSAAVTLGQVGGGQVGGLDAALEDTASIDLGYADNGGFTRTFTGLVSALRTGLLERHVMLVSAARALARLRVDQTFEGQTAGAIVSDLAGRAKVPLGTIDDGITFPSYVIDFRRTALAHVRDLAALSGMDAYVDSDGKLVFQAFTTGQAVHDVDFAKHILTLDIERDDAADASVQAFGESPTGSAGAESWGWLTKDFARSEGKAGSGSRAIVLERPALRTSAAAATAASARLRAIQRRAVRGHVLMMGRPGVKLGDAIRIREVPTAALNDIYQVRRVLHRVTKDGGFTTQVGFCAIASERLA